MGIPGGGGLRGEPLCSYALGLRPKAPQGITQRILQGGGDGIQGLICGAIFGGHGQFVGSGKCENDYDPEQP